MTEQRKTVTLIHPDGRPYEASTPLEINDLCMGHGYRPKSGTVDEAMAAVADKPTAQASPRTAGTAEPTVSQQGQQKASTVK